MNKAKTITKVIISLIVVIVVVSAFFLWKNIDTKNKEEKQLKKEKEIIKEIKNHYHIYVKTNKDTKLYQKKNNKYIVIGTISKDEELILKKINITKDTKYFKIDKLNYYINYQDLEKINSLSTQDLRYKKYIPFNENVKTKTNVKLYNQNKKALTLNYSLDLPIIEKGDNEDGVFVEVFDKYYFIKNEDIETIYNHQNNTLTNALDIPVTVYHFIYSSNEECNEIICHPESQIISHFEYLKQENYFTITTKELRLWNEGKLRLPEKSILVTIDDGAKAENFIPLLEKYKINATLFLVTSWYPLEAFKSDYLEIASHTDNLHTQGVCPDDQGSPLKCLPKEELITDLNKSREKTNSEAFCYPFYEFNNHALEAVKEAGFKIAFIGGGEKVTLGINNFKIPRITILKNTTLEEYKNYIS